MDLSADVGHHDAHDILSLHEDLFQNSVQNEMLTHYNRIFIGCFKDCFQSIDTNNLAEVLQALKELSFMLANRALELAAHYNMALELCQFLQKKYLNLLRGTSTVLHPKTLSTASKEDPTLEVINTIGTTDSYLHY